jgi:hypothetical protein
MAIPPLLFLAHGDRAESWAEVIRRSRQIELLAMIDLSAGGVEGVEDALVARPEAAVAVWASGPREATRLAERLVEHPGPAILHPAPARPPVGHGVQLSHGWLTLSGIGALERLFMSRSVESVRLEARGLPEGPGLGVTAALYHAATLIQRFGHEVRVDRAVLPHEDEITLTLAVDGVPWRVDVHSRGSELRFVVRTAEGDYTWSADSVSETLQRPRAEPRAMPAVPWAERCLRQLVSPAKGADLSDARAVRAMVDAVEVALERRLPPDRAVRDTVAPGLAGLGLAGEPPDAAPLAPTRPPSSPLPLEAMAYAFELKPAVFLTVAPQDEARVRASLPGIVERRDRLVSVSAGDRWDDRRERGEPRVELYAARALGIARQLAELQQSDPSERLSQIGALLGYPACCVQAFAAMGDRSDNSHARVAIAARTSIGPGPWPSLLDDTSLKLLPHFPCTYRCERSLEQARALLSALADEDKPLCAEILHHLGGPVLYFDHDHQLRFDGEVKDGMSVRYRAVSMPWSPSEPFARFAGAVALGDRLVLADTALHVYLEGERLFTLVRTDPGLGVLMPFGPRHPL